MSEIERLVKLEKDYRAKAQAHEKRAEENWNKANEIFLEIQGLIEEEPDSEEESSSYE